MFICKGALPEQRVSRVTPLEYDALSGSVAKMSRQQSPGAGEDE